MGTSKRMSSHDLNEKEWAKLSEDRNPCIFQVDGELSDATLLQRKHAVKELITTWCAAAVRQHTLATSSPPRGEKRALEEDAVAAEGACHTTAFDTAVAAASSDVPAAL